MQVGKQNIEIGLWGKYLKKIQRKIFNHIVENLIFKEIVENQIKNTILGPDIWRRESNILKLADGKCSLTLHPWLRPILQIFENK